MRVHVHALLTFTCATATATAATLLNAQPFRAQAGLGAMHSSGAELGTGTGMEFNLRLQSRALPLMSLLARANLSSFGRTTLRTSNRAFFPDAFPEVIRAYNVRASVASVMVGPELAHSVRGTRGYLHVLGGISDVTSRGDFSNMYAVGVPMVFVNVPPAELKKRRSAVSSMLIGAGLRRRLIGALVGDVGASRTIAGNAIWTTEGPIVIIGPTPPARDFRRSASMWSWRAGISFGGAAR
jgi:hypothetical protein